LTTSSDFCADQYNTIITTAPLPLNIREKIICAAINHHIIGKSTTAPLSSFIQQRRVEGDSQ
jgi:hypothetical protein